MHAESVREKRLKASVVLLAALVVVLAVGLLVWLWHPAAERTVLTASPSLRMQFRAELFERHVIGSDVRVSGWARRGTPLVVYVDPRVLSDFPLGRLAIVARVPGAERPFAAWMVGDAFQAKVPLFETSAPRVAEIPGSESWDGLQRLELATYLLFGYEELSSIRRNHLVPLEGLRERLTEWIEATIDVQRSGEVDLPERAAEAVGVEDALLEVRVVLAERTNEDASTSYVAMAQQSGIAAANTFPVARIDILRGRQLIAFFDIQGYVDPRYEWALWHEVHVLEGQTLEDPSELSAELVVTETMLEQAIDQPGTWVGRAPIGRVKVLPNG